MPTPYLYQPPYTDQQRMYLRKFMGYSKLFKSSNSMFENILDLIQSVPAFDDGATFNETIVLMNNINNLEVLRLQNASLGFATESSTQTKVDAVRNNDFIMKIGRSYIKQLSVIFSMKPAQDFYRAAPPDTSGNIYPVAYDY